MGDIVGVCVGDVVGVLVGKGVVGDIDGTRVGVIEGTSVGDIVGVVVGNLVGSDGAAVGPIVGAAVQMFPPHDPSASPDHAQHCALSHSPWVLLTEHATHVPNAHPQSSASAHLLSASELQVVGDTVGEGEGASVHTSPTHIELLTSQSQQSTRLQPSSS